MRRPTLSTFPIGLLLLVGCSSSTNGISRAGEPDGSTTSGGASGASGAAGASQSGNGGTAGNAGGGTTAGNGGTGNAGGAPCNGCMDASAPSDAGAVDSGPVDDPSWASAVAVKDFLESIGVCTHIGQGIDDATKTATALSYAGIREIRDDGNAAHVDDWIKVHALSGARLSLLTNRDVPSTIDMAKQLAATGSLLAVEGANEPNNFAVTYQGSTSDNTTFMPVAALQRDLYAAVKAEPALSGIPVFHSSEAGGSEPDNVGLQFLKIPNNAMTAMPDGTAYADYANTHNYIVGHSAQLSNNLCWNAEDPTLNGDWDSLYVEYGKTWRGHYAGYSDLELQTLPRVTTETGWTTSGDASSITEEQQGRLFLNLYLAAFKRGWRYTFIYMLRDDPGQGYWGLFDTTYAAKKSGAYLHNFTTILADDGARTPRRLDYSLGAPPATVHDLLLQKSDGTFELVVWNERPSGGSDDVTVTLGTSHATVRVYDPTTGTTPTTTLSGVTSVALTLSDHPMVVEL